MKKINQFLVKFRNKIVQFNYNINYQQCYAYAVKIHYLLYKHKNTDYVN